MEGLGAMTIPATKVFTLSKITPQIINAIKIKFSYDFFTLELKSFA
ncbi:MAG: hypothetical protein IJR94_00015 [Synergistaceae bacterium]|nr:hypothetical protein [Synergistaceae bacterium]